MKKIILLCTLITMTGCATVPANWGTMGGSKSDATVKLAYTKGAFQRITQNDSLALTLATKRCVAWGYKSAVAFEFETSKCTSFYNGSCMSEIYTREYQCN